jgi:hypothetical protein
MMKKLFVLAVVGLMASTANAGLLYMADMETGSLEGVTLAGPSDVAEIGIYYDIQGAIHVENIAFVGVAFKPGYDTGCMEIIHAENFLLNDLGNPWFTVDREVGQMGVITPDPAPHGFGIQPSGYFLSAGDEDPQNPPPIGKTGPAVDYLMEVITVHCLEAYCDQPLYFDLFQGKTSFQNASYADIALWPLGASFEYSIDNAFGVFWDAWNGRHPDDFAPGLWPNDRPFVVTQLPEPASLALLALGGLALLRRK